MSTDILEIARRIVVEDHGIDIEGELQSRCIEMVSDAIEEERLRCVYIASKLADEHDSRTGDRIAAAILTPSKTRGA